MSDETLYLTPLLQSSFLSIISTLVSLDLILDMQYDRWFRLRGSDMFNPSIKADCYFYTKYNHFP